ncbi:hypothetical protein LZ32DRAFT_664429 [Colletotrichum eremochloae]|nr:hypothetical protein LZ32DRAFT_664429 [Colletotrichum eremochloae]
MVMACENEERCRILILKSRLSFGVCDDWIVGELGYASINGMMNNGMEIKRFHTSSLSNEIMPP